MATIKLKNLRLRAIIGINDYERVNKQDIILNIKIKFDDSAACRTENIDDTINYKEIKRKIIDGVESSSFLLLEKLTDFVLDIIFEEPKVIKSAVEIDKPNALRFVDSVSILKKRKRS